MQQSLRRAYRMCMAEFMDSHQEVYAAPRAPGCRSWCELAERDEALSEMDQLTVDRLLGAIASMYRALQIHLGEGPSLAQAYSAVFGAAADGIDADPVAMRFDDSGEPDEDALAFGKSMAVYKQLIGEGVVRGDELQLLMSELIDTVPATSDLLLDLRELLKRFAVIEIEAMVGVPNTAH
jgi:hypothetical protein